MTRTEFSEMPTRRTKHPSVTTRGGGIDGQWPTLSHRRPESCVGWANVYGRSHPDDPFGDLDWLRSLWRRQPVKIARTCARGWGAEWDARGGGWIGAAQDQARTEIAGAAVGSKGVAMSDDDVPAREKVA